MPASVDATVPEQRIVEQAARIGDRGAVTGWSSLRMHGVGYLDGREEDGRTRMPVRAVLTSGQLRSDDALDLLREPLDPMEVEVVHGIRCTTVERALFDEMRRVGFVQAVIATDMASAAGLVTVRGQWAFTSDRLSSRGASRALTALRHARDGSASPSETRLRLVWTLRAGLPAPLLNQPLFDSTGSHLGTVDLLDPTTGLAGEFDGADHRTAGRHAADVDREDRLRRAGIEVVRATGSDLRRPRLLAERILAARQRALAVAESGWTLDQPDWFLRRQRFT